MRVLYSDRGFAFLFFELRRCMRMIVFLSEIFYLFFRATCSCCLNLCLEILEGVEGKGAKQEAISWP